MSSSRSGALDEPPPALLDPPPEPPPEPPLPAAVIAATGTTTLTATAAIEHGQFPTEPLQNDLRGVVVAPILALPLAGL